MAYERDSRCSPNIVGWHQNGIVYSPHSLFSRSRSLCCESSTITNRLSAWLLRSPSMWPGVVAVGGSSNSRSDGSRRVVGRERTGGFGFGQAARGRGDSPGPGRLGGDSFLARTTTTTTSISNHFLQGQSRFTRTGQTRAEYSHRRAASAAPRRRTCPGRENRGGQKLKTFRHFRHDRGSVDNSRYQKENHGTASAVPRARGL